MLLSAPMDSLTKSIINESGYEEWSKQEIEQDYKISKEKLEKSHRALIETRNSNLIRDVAAYEAMIAKKPPGPPGRHVKHQ